LPSPLRDGLYAVAPEPTIALKAALYEALRKRGITVTDLALRLDLEEREAARLLDPRARARLTSLEAALAALGYEIGIEVREKRIA
jgi:antitoxin HicB